jgi:uncharacterized YccA/Bax inhibitor family protein
MRTLNPALNKNTFKHIYPHGTDVMTIEGTVNKTFFLLLGVILPAWWSWNLVLSSNSVPYLKPLMYGSIICGLIVAIITVFKKEWSPVTAPLYALIEGIAIGAISSFMEQIFPGIVIQAVALTFGTLFCLLWTYKSGLIKVTDNFRLGIVAATGGIAMIYLLTFVLGFFGVAIPYIHDNGLIGIGFSLFVVVIAALTLVLDFDFIEKGSEIGAPGYMEWYAAFGLIVSLIWLYLEILRLLSKIRSR